MACEVSVLIPTYNRARLLDRCLESVLAYPRENIEVLVADNATTDDTPNILAKFGDPRLRYWRHAINVGIERNILSLVRAAKGEWIFFLTDDDYLLPGGLEKLLAVAKAQPNSGVILSDARAVDIDGNYIRTFEFYGETKAFAAGLDALIVFFEAAHVLSRIFMRRQWVDLAGTEATLGSLYPQMYMVGSVVREHPAFYLKESIVAHTMGNVTDWDYTADFMIGPRIAMIKHLLPLPEWRREREALLSKLRDEIRTSHFPVTYHRSLGAFLRHQLALLRHPEVALSLQYWSSLADFAFSGGWRFIKRNLRAT